MGKEIGSEALIPNSALKAFGPLIGEWKATGTHPYFPGVTFHGRWSYSWHEGGAFVVMHSEIDEPQIPSGVAIFGSDDAAGTYFMSYFDERGVSRRYDVAVTAFGLNWWRDDPKFSQRTTLSIGADWKTMESRGQMSRDGAEWETDLALYFVRVER